MKQILAFVLCLCIICGLLTACGNTTEQEPYTIMEMEDYDGPVGLVSIEDDYCASTSYSLRSDGLLTRTTRYNLSGEEVVTVVLNEENMKFVRSVLKNLWTFLPLSGKHSEGENKWDIRYLNAGGDVKCKYTGAIYGHKRLRGLRDMFEEALENGEVIQEREELPPERPDAILAEITQKFIKQDASGNYVWVYIEWEIRYNGRVEYKKFISAELDDEEYIKIETSVVDDIISIFEQYAERGDDGKFNDGDYHYMYFEYYDEERNEICCFNGYCDDIDYLMRLHSILENISEKGI